ncbi:hypothetical protein Droror1_Dr00026739 [Drosera rotundifolia]
MADDDTIAALPSQLSSLQNQVKELKIENAKLKSRLAGCWCGSNQEVDNVSDRVENGESVSTEACKQLQKGKGSRSRKGSNGGTDHYSTIMHQLPRRYVALEVMYFGERFYGFASEAHMKPTVESELFRAFEQLRLLAGDKKESKYSRCGRTDKGVSAVGQVICLYLRSKFKEIKENDSSFAEEEIDYVKILNNVLPKDIRILGWCPVPLDFHARFSCLSREYKYFFWRENLDISAMKIAGKKFLGEHDFRNFCKMDASNVHNYKRCVISFEITQVDRFKDKELWAVNIKGSAFLWHQVRCMVAVLFMIGQGLESVDIISQLLNIESTDRKPQYTIAPELPLVLQSCEFDRLQFISTSDARQAVCEHLENEISSLILQAAIFREALGRASSTRDGGRTPIKATRKKASHVPLMERATEPSYEERRSKLNWGGSVVQQRLLSLSLETELD